MNGRVGWVWRSGYIIHRLRNKKLSCFFPSCEDVGMLDDKIEDTAAQFVISDSDPFSETCQQLEI